MFDAKTRDASQENLRGFGDAFAGRGAAVERTIEEAPRLFGHLEPVARNLADPETELAALLQGARRRRAHRRADLETNARLFTDDGRHLRGVGRATPRRSRTFIAKSPPTMDAAISSFQVQRPFLRDLTAFSEDSPGATAELRGALPDINPALETGTRCSAEGARAQRAARGPSTRSRDLTSAPSTNAAIRALTATVTTLNPQLRFYGPYVTVCNSWNYFFTYLAEHFSEPDSTGVAQRALLNSPAARTTRSARSAPTSRPTARRSSRATSSTCTRSLRRRDRRPTGAPTARPASAATSSATPASTTRSSRSTRTRARRGVQGPTFTGRPRVPEGQTFTAMPETGPYAAEADVDERRAMRPRAAA